MAPCAGIPTESPLNLPRAFKFLFITITGWYMDGTNDVRLPLGHSNKAVSAALPIRHWSSQRGKFLLLMEVSDNRR